MTVVSVIASIVFGALAWFVHLRKSGARRHWTNQTTGERILLSVILASVFQFVFFLPGWIVAAVIVGYRDISATPVYEFLFTIVALTANVLIYSPAFYSLLSGISKIVQTRSRFD